MVLMLRDRSVHGRILGCAAVLMGGLTLLLTFSRASWLGTGVGLGLVVVLICLVGRAETARVSILRRLFRFLIPAAILGGISYITVVVAQGGFLQQRVAAIPSDLIGRLTLSTDALTMMDSTISAHLFGMGLGSFPRSYYQRNKSGVRPTRRQIVDEFGERYLRSVGGKNGPNDSGETLFTVGQSISLKHGLYQA